MKKKIYMRILLFFFILMVPSKVWCASLNDYETKFIEMLTYKYEFNGAYYKVPDVYLEQVIERLSNNNPDWDKAKYDQYVKMFFSNFKVGIEQGVFVKVGTVKKKKPANEQYNNNIATEDEDTDSYYESPTTADDILGEELDNISGEELDDIPDTFKGESDIILHVGNNGELTKDLDYSDISTEDESGSEASIESDSTTITSEANDKVSGANDIVNDKVSEANDKINEVDSNQLQGDTEPIKLGNVQSDIFSKILVIVCAVIFFSIVVVILKKKTGKR